MATKISWTVRPMRPEDIDKCLTIWSRVELTEARETVLSSLRTDPNGFYVAELDSTAEVVGMCAGPITRPDTAFMGFYAVEPEYQGLGIGRDLWSRTSSRLESNINLGLYGVPGMSEKYRKSGFAVEDTIRMLIFESTPNSTVGTQCLRDIDELPAIRLVSIEKGTDESLFQKLLDYDKSVQKHSREALLRDYLQQIGGPLTLAVVRDTANKQVATSGGEAHLSGTTGERKSSCCARPNQEAIKEDEALTTSTTMVRRCSASSALNQSGARQSAAGGELLSIGRASSPIDIPSPGAIQPVGGRELAGPDLTSRETATNSTEQLEVLGYGCIRLDNNLGGLVGPIYADSSDLAEVILKNLLDRFYLRPGAIYSVMALSSNKNACKILTKIGLKEQDQCSRMFTKFVPTASFSKIFYVHSPNFSLF